MGGRGQARPRGSDWNDGFLETRACAGPPPPNPHHRLRRAPTQSRRFPIASNLSPQAARRCYISTFAHTTSQNSATCITSRDALHKARHAFLIRMVPRPGIRCLCPASPSGVAINYVKKSNMPLFSLCTIIHKIYGKQASFPSYQIRHSSSICFIHCSNTF